MIARILSRIQAWRTRRADRIEAEYQEAQRVYLRCQARGDARGKGEAWPRLREATIAKLEAEVGCRGISWRGSR